MKSKPDKPSGHQMRYWASIQIEYKISLCFVHSHLLLDILQTVDYLLGSILRLCSTNGEPFLGEKNVGPGEDDLRKSGDSSSPIPGVASVLMDGEGCRPVGSGPWKSTMASDCREPT